METKKIKLSQIKKGDKFKAGNSTYVAESKSYFNGVWAVDIGQGFLYGWTQFDQEITVERN